MVRGDGRARGYASRGTWAVGAALLTALITATAWAASVTYVYDEAGRLKQVLYDDGAQVSYKLDAAGNRTQVTSAAATPVNAPTGLTAQPASDNSVALSWTAATGGTGQFTYYLYRNGTQLPQSITTTSTTDAGLALEYLLFLHSVRSRLGREPYPADLVSFRHHLRHPCDRIVHGNTGLLLRRSICPGVPVMLMGRV